MSNSIVLAVDEGIDQFINCSVSLDLNLIDSLDVPLGKDQELVELFGEVLYSQFNANFNREVSEGLVVQLLEVLTLADRVRSVLPQIIQRCKQLTITGRSAGSSSNSNREVLNAPVNSTQVKEGLQDTELFDFTAID